MSLTVREMLVIVLTEVGEKAGLRTADASDLARLEAYDSKSHPDGHQCAHCLEAEDRWLVEVCIDEDEEESR